MRRFLLFVMMLVTTIVNAANLLTKQYIGSVYYNIYDDGTAEATYGTLQSPENYSGDIQIRSSVTVNGKSYTVTAIGEDAFYASSRMTSIFIPNTVKTIGATAFYGCTGLNEIDIPNSVTTIEDKAFQNCSGLNTFTLGDNLTSLGASVFSGCYLKKLDMSNSTFKKLEKETFSGSISTIILPKSLEILPESAFFNVMNLYTLDMGHTAFKVFDKEIFSGSSVKSIVLPSTLESLPENTFSLINGLSTIDMTKTSFTSISKNVFHGNNQIENVYLPEKLKSISDSAFRGCGKLKFITIPNSVSSIGNYAFSGCYNLNFVEFPNSVTSIGDYAFNNCSKLNSVEISNLVTSIGDYAFSNCSGLKYVSLGSSLSSLGSYSFYGCSSLNTINMTNAPLKTFGRFAFAKCPKLENIYLPESLEVVPEYAFCCYLIKQMEHHYWYDDEDEDDAPYTYIGYNETCKKISIPNSVKRIEKSAFENFINVSSIELGESVEYIGDHAFYFNAFDSYKDDDVCYYGKQYYYNTSLSKLIIPNSVKIIDDWAFGNYLRLGTIEFGNSLESIGNYAFYCVNSNGYEHFNTDCYEYHTYDYSYHTISYVNISLTELDFPNSLKSIGESAFASMKRLERLRMRSSLKTIGSRCFSECSKLDSVMIPNSVTSVGDSAFANCSSLKYVDWQVMSSLIPSRCFWGCSSLKSFTVPNSVMSIEGAAFSGCSELYSITIPGSVTEIANTSLSGCSECIVYLCNDNISSDHEAFKPVKKVATCDNVPMPVEINYAFFYTGKEQLYNIPDNAAYTVTGNRRTDAGSQDVVIALKDGFSWTNGTSDTLVFDFTIYPAQLLPEQTVFKGYLGQTLGDITLPKGCQWVDDPSMVLEYAGDNRFAVKYTPEGWTKEPLLVEMTVIVSKLQIEPPLADTTVYYYNGKEQTYNLPETDFYKVSNPEDLTKKEVGTYYIYVGLKNKANCEWSDGTTDSRTYFFTINRQPVEIPAEDTTEFIYTGKELTYHIPESPLYTVSNNVNTWSGNYSVRVSLNDNSTYMWSDGTVWDKYYDFYIKKPYVNIPAADTTEFIYTGENLTYNIPESPFYTVSNNVHAEVGYYEVKVSLNEPYNYEWSDGTTWDKYYSFYIKKPYVKAPVVDYKTFTYTGDSITFEIPENEHYTVSGNVQINVGYYEARVSLTDPYNYAWEDGSTYDKWYEFRIEKKKVLIPSPNYSYFTYNGKPQTLPIASNDAFTTVIGFDNNSGYYGSDSTQTNVGYYNVILQLKDKENSMWVYNLDDYYGYTNNQIYSFSIDRAFISSFPEGLDPKELELEARYGDVLKDVILPKEYSWMNPGKSVGEVGENSFFAHYYPSDDNYYDTVVSIPVNVKPQLVEVPKADPTLFYYTAKPQVYTLESNDLYTMKNNVQTNVGTHNVIVSLKDKDNYAWSSTKNSKDLNYKFVISKSDEAIFELGYNPNEINPKVQYGQKLGDVTLPTRFSWKEPETIADKIGDNKYVVVYTPSDPDNYNTIETEIVVNVLKRKVVFPSKDSRLFVYNGSAQTYEVGESDLYEVSNNVQTNAGRYDVTVALKDKDHYEWQDGTTDDIYQDFIIRTKSIEMPSIASKSFVYDGKSHSLSIPSSKDYTISGNKGTDAGRYEVSLSLVDKKNYVWENNTTSDIVTSFSISKIKVDMPSADNSSFTYTGEPLTYKIAESDLYTVAGNVQTAAGRYDVKVSLNNPRNYEWMDGTTDNLVYVFYIKSLGAETNLAKVDIPSVDTKKFVYDGKNHTLELVDNDLYTVDDKGGINVGRYSATLSLKDKDKYVWENGLSDDISISYLISKAQVAIPAKNTKTYTYNAKNQTYSLASNALYTISNNVQKNAGRYEVKVSLVDSKNYEWEDGSSDDINYLFKINKAKVNAPDADATTFIYSGKPQTYNIVSSSYYKVANNVQTNVGSYDVVVSLSDAKNYMWSDGSSYDLTYNFVIKTEDANQSVVKIPVVATRNFIYNGKTQTLDIPESDDYIISDNKRINAGRYVATLTLVDPINTVWSDGTKEEIQYVFNIAKASVEMPDVDHTRFVYTGKPQTYNILSSELYSVTGNIQTKVGQYEVNVALNDAKNYMWQDGTIDDLSYNFVIRAEEVEKTEIAIPSIADNKFVYDGKAHSLNIKSNDDYIVYNNKGVNAGRYTVTLSLTDPAKTVWSDGSTDDIKLSFSIVKAQVQIPESDSRKFVYDGNAKYYELPTSSLYTITNDAQTNAGRYEVNVSLKDIRNYEWEDGRDYDLTYIFTINKAQVEIPAADQTKFVYTGKAQTYKLVADTAYTIDGNEQTMPGKYEVLVSLNDVKNYEWSNGTTETLSYSFVIRAEETELTPVAIPSVATKNFIYDGSAKSLKIASSKNYTVTGNYGVNAGRYTVTLALTDPTKTVWSDGSVDDIKMNFTIAKSQVMKPFADDHDFVYNGYYQTYVTYNVHYDHLYEVTNNVQKNAGKYAVKISLKDAKNYEWEDGSIDDLSYNFTINKAQVEIPIADQTKFVYTGKAQTYKLVADTTYLIEGNEQTMPGRYSVLVSLNDTRNYEWSNGTTEVLSYSFVILTEDIELTPVAIPSVATKNFIYDGSAKSLKIASSKNYTVTGNYGVNAGRYTVTIALTDPTKTVWSDGSVDDIKMTFTIDKAMVEIPAADTKNYVYNRRTQIYKIASDTAYTVSGNAHINAGNYLVSVTLNDTKNYMWTDGTVDVQKYNFVIAKAQVEIPAADKTVYEYEGMPITYKIAESSLYNVTDNKQTLPGKYEVHVNLVDLKNYEWNDGTTSELTYNFVIRYKAPVKKSIDVPTVLDRIFVYDGSVKSIAIENNAYYTVTGNEGVNAGKYSVRLSLNDPDMTVWSDGSSDDVLMSFQILKARVDMPVADQTKFVYTGKEQTYNIASDSIYTVEGNKQTMPGKYEVLVSLNDDKNYEWANGSIDVLSYNFVIRVKEDSKKVIEIPTNLTRNFIYDGKPKSLDLVSGNGYEVTGNSGVTVGRYSVRLSLTDNKSTVWSDGSIDDIVMTFQISKAQVMIPAADPSKFFYTADSLTYTVAKSDLYSVSGNRQINVGNHDVVISLNDTKNYEWNDGTIGDIVYSFMISKQEIDITTVGIPVVKIKEFTYDGDAHTLDVPSSKYYSVTGNKKTVAGKYVATVSLKDKSTMVWEDGRTDDLKIQYSITKALVKIPAADSTEFVYDGESHTYMIPDSRYYKVSGNEQTLVGRHFVTVSLVDHANYMWADGTSDDLQYEFVIKLKETNITPVAIPVVSKSNFIYNGKSQTLDIKKSDYYTISGNSQKLAGSYTAKVALKDKENTSWADGTTADLVIPFTIAKSSIAIPSANATKFVYNGESMTCSVNKNSDYVISGNTNVEAGNYKAKVSLVDKSNTVWENGSSEDIFIPYSIAKVEVEKPIANTTAFVYNGKEKKLDLASSKWYSITDNSGVLAGKYVVNIALVDKANTVWSDGTVDDIEIPFSIAKSQVAIPATSDAKLVYNGDTLIYPVESNSKYAVSGNINVKAGNYQAKVSLYDKENTVWADGSSDDIMIPYSIAKIQLEKPTTDSTSFVYNGDTMTVELTSNEWYDITGNDGVKAGKYVANISLIDKANTVWNDGTTDDVEIPFSIAKAQVEIPTVDTTLFFYTGDTLIYSVAENENYTVKGNAQTMIGRYSVVVSLNDIENYSWSDGSSLDLIYPFIINEREIVKTLVSRPVADTVKLVYNGEMQTLSIEADSNCVVSGNIRKDAGKYLATVSLVDRMTMSWDDGTTDDVIIPFSIVKAQVEIPEADTTVFQFNGEEQTYKIAEDSLYTVEGNVQSLVGRYEVYVSLVDINNYEWTNGTTEDLMYRFAIIHPIVIDTVNIEDIKISGSTIESGDTVVVYDNPGDYIFDITFDSVAKELGFKDVKAEPGDSGIRIIVPEDAKPGNYEATVTIKDIDGTVKDTTLKFSVCYPSTMIKRLMYDVLAVDNNTQEFVSYQWYKDGKKIEGATDQFYCDLDGVKGVYKVEIVNVAGDTLFIAEREFEAIALPFNVTLSKNPVNSGEEFTVTIEGITESNILASSSLVVYDMKGTVAINKIGIDKRNTISIGNVGEYIVVVRIIGGQTVSKHLLVK